MNDLGLPPDRDLPSQVRDRIHANVRAGMNQPHRHRLRAPLGIAAAVAVLVGGAAYVGGVGGSTDTPVAAATAATLDRCWAAVQDSGKAEAFPAREEWRQRFREVLDATTVTGITTGEKTLVCETSLTSVSVSEPVTGAPEEGRLRGVLNSPNGTVVGLAGAGVEQVEVALTEQANSQARPVEEISMSATVRDGVFVAKPAYNDLREWEPSAFVPGLPGRQPLDAPPPAVYELDRPVDRPERSSPAGTALEKCLDRPGNSGGAVVDANTWRAAALFDRHFPARKSAPLGDKAAQAYDSTVVVATNDRATATCTTAPHRDFRVLPSADDVTSPEQPVTPLQGENHFPGLAVYGVTGENVASIRLESAGETATVEVRDRTFVAYVPGVEIGKGDIGAASVSVTAFGASGEVLHRGDLPEVPKSW